MTAAVVATQLTTPDTTRAYTVTVNSSADITGNVYMPSLTTEDQGTNVQATTSFEIRGVTLASLPNVKQQALVEVYDHTGGVRAARGFIDSHEPDMRPGPEHAIIVTCSDHTSLLDNVIPFEARPAGESDQARLGYLWGKYAGPYLNADFSQVQQIAASLPAQVFAGISLRQAIDMIAAQASTSARWYLDLAGRLHYFTSESNDAPFDVTSDTPGAGEIAAAESLRIDFDSKNFTSKVYVRGKTDAGSGWVQSEAAKLNANGLERSRFLEAPDCTTEAMRNALGNMYLGRLNAARARGSFTIFSPDAGGTRRDGWQAEQNVNVRSSQHDVDQSYRIARVRTVVLGPASIRRYDVEFGNARAGSDGGLDPPIVMGQTLSGDLVDDNGALLLSSSPNAWTGGLGPALRRYITSGVYNGDFALAPNSPDSAIVNTWNPLPFWSFVIASGTAIFAYSVADSGQGSERAIQLQMIEGAAGDDVYLEQIIPINSSRTQNWYYNPRATVRTGSTVSDAVVYLTTQYLLADGETTTGTAHTNSSTTTAIGTSTLHDLASIPGGTAAPTDAYFLRVRVGFKRDAAATSVTETVTFTEIACPPGFVRSHIVDQTDPANYGPGRLFQDGGSLALEANFTKQSGLGSGSQPRVTLDGSGASPVLQISTLGGNPPLLRLSHTAFPASPVSGDIYYRSDLGMWCQYDGTRWLSAKLYEIPIHPTGQYAFPFTATVVSGNRAMVPSAGVYALWAETLHLTFYVQGGTALSGSHKWVSTLAKNPAGTTIATITVNSGASDAYRHDSATIDAVIATTEFELDMTHTKTGTPGDFYALATLTYRLILT